MAHWEPFDNAIVFQDRHDAGKQLATHLMQYREQNPIVLALPRGGVVVGYEVAQALNAPLDVIVARKLGAPGHEELGIGAIAPGGVLVRDDLAIRYLGVTEEQLQRTITRETAEMERRIRSYRGDRPFPDLHGKTVILVDDGLATGVTARAAIRSIRQQNPQRIVLAVPVCAAETAQALRGEADEVICASTPINFRAVGLWYEDFEQVTDDEVITLLQQANREIGAPA
ncbi:MAG TPA: phosphoribosyltransferase [Chthonomonadaceae bacterium]|nr:phosphoribosyltransferase [Chthonomonadaceae bacterium]